MASAFEDELIGIWDLRATILLVVHGMLQFRRGLSQVRHRCFFCQIRDGLSC
ncbi:hypothetical protein PAXRUDRAFT_833334 [Paxillus rubicundulus Ve08.2h10]|uniref:Unplaced genomic scaffold scaffold_1107, whole genome shotgun sequence n=1 Tax=Paxillus rubicundulus Ve08.2h10 TaxID=930991 RepID=A0A0D0CDL5_9AGAM|nr:hypothetical protein PAXRUDRAFT_833334 [Paxillus rubicundulus Ve08.2h10]